LGYLLRLPWRVNLMYLRLLPPELFGSGLWLR
jgi:hypothetical protein